MAMASFPVNPARVVVICAECHERQSPGLEQASSVLAEVTYTLCAACAARRIAQASDRMPAVPPHARFEFAPGAR
jgi:hypothetical protein